MHRKAPSIDGIWECIFETTKPINRLNRVPGLDAESGSETWHTRYDEYGRLRNEPQTALVTGPLPHTVRPDVLLPIFAMRRTPAKQHDTRAHGKQRHRCQPRNGYTGIGDERLGIGAIAVLRNTSRTGAARFGSSRRLPPDFHCLPREWSSHCHRDWEFHHRPVSWSRPAY